MTAAKRKPFRDEGGAELVELALALPLLLLVVMGVIDTSFLFRNYLVLTDVAREGARVAMLPDYQANVEANVRRRVFEDYLDHLGLTDPAREVSVDYVPILPGGCAVRITLRYPYGWNFAAGLASAFGGPLENGRLQAVSTMRLENPAACP
jgi:hypothetical protein